MLLPVASDLSADGSNLAMVGSVCINSQDPNTSPSITTGKTSADLSGLNFPKHLPSKEHLPFLSVDLPGGEC